ncbi:MAG TPA: restriction endonuclease [Rhizomicrobium sp.]|nr:restriction endonuclease [Rhizomicrobium sp.]
MARTRRGPAFCRLFAPVLDVLRELGDSGRPEEVTERVATRLEISGDELNRTNKNGRSHFANEVAWARFYLAKAGLIDTSQRGVWALTEAGRKARPDHVESLHILDKAALTFRRRSEIAGSSEEDSSPPDEQEQGDEVFRSKMAKMLLSLSPDGFERLCKRILREVGFEEVVVTGQRGDGGIDGYGILRINRLIADRVLFQCKRHADQISPGYIREFRGSMDGRADRGIFLATSNFSAEARREAKRDGAVPIQMVDLDGIVSLLKELRLGVNVQTVFEINEDFFQEFISAVPKAREQIDD